jgi:hypothetical protein
MIGIINTTSLQLNILEIALLHYKIDLDNLPDSDSSKRCRLWATVNLLSQVKRMNKIIQQDINCI